MRGPKRARTARANSLVLSLAVTAAREHDSRRLGGEPPPPRGASPPPAPPLPPRRFGVELDPETQVVSTIGAKEGLSHLMWVLLGPGDAALVPSPSYPIHIHAPILAGASVFRVAMGPDEEDLF